ncbi:MAG: cysteine peptidase family C39 domain-containing protein [Bacteroidetes bacterium]|jgi:ABC-type bacteriocin/lantibiotic exporter with double-glycine peptidase domain|nr:cysteine peptidase family C39 domain-containing protein [Bacteroidota bacterium]
MITSRLLLAASLLIAVALFLDCREKASREPAANNAGVVRQSKHNTCGPAALAMLLTSLGRPATENEMERAMFLGSEGATLTSLLAASASRGVQLEAWRLQVDTLRSIRTPAILWVDGDHFVVFDSITSTGAHVRDPSVGRTVISLERLQERWDGTAALVVWPP